MLTILIPWALFKLSMPCAQTKQLVVVSPYKYPSKGKLHRACDKPNIRLLAVVISAPQNVKMRKMIRKTWGHVMKTSQSMSVVFFVGHSTDEGVNIAIIWENHRYNDIVTGDFVESYKNLSLKGLHFIEWTYSHCSHVKWVLKVDDDVVVNPYKLHSYIMTRNSETNRIHCSYKKTPMVCRNSSTKWYVSREAFSDDYYSSHCMGYAYLLSFKTIPKLLKAQRIRAEPPFVWEDVFFTGILASQAKIRLRKMNTKYQIKPTVVQPRTIFVLPQDASLNSPPSKGRFEELWREMNEKTELFPI